jgi:hypothetical protein
LVSDNIRERSTMADHADVRGYYRIVGVSSSASPGELKRSYRRLAKELHPDRHPNDPAATSKFQALNEAHAVLSDPEKRAAYDAACMASQAAVPNQMPTPIVCSCCGAVSAQPRYVVYWYVISVLVATFRKPIQGVFCPSCAKKKAIQASAVTWLLGWWGFPWGPLWSLKVLYQNLTNAVQPAEVNAQILGRQGSYFFAQGKPDLAAAVLTQALRFKSSESLRETLTELRKAIPGCESFGTTGSLEPASLMGLLGAADPGNRGDRADCVAQRN